MKRIIAFSIVLLASLFIVSPTIWANYEIDMFLQEESMEAILANLPYTLYLDKELLAWAKPKLTVAEENRARNYIYLLQGKSYLSSVEKNRLGLLHLVLADEEKAIKYLLEAFEEGNTGITTLEPLLYLSVKNGDQSLLTRVQTSWQRLGFPLRNLNFALGIRELKKGFPIKGEDYLRQSIEQGYFGPSYLALAVVNLENEDLLTAGEYILTARERHRDKVLIQYFTGLYYVLKGEGPEAYSHFRSLPNPLALPGKFLLPYLENLTQYLPKMALPYWEDMLGKKNYFISTDDIYLNIATCFFKSGEGSKAINYLEKVNSDNPVGKALLIEYYKDNDPELAKKHLVSLKDLIGTSFEYYLEMVSLQIRLLEFDEATQILKGLNKVYPDRAEGDAALEEIKKQKGGLWWLTKGLWLKADDVSETPGVLNRLPLFKTITYARGTEIYIVHPERSNGGWFSLDGLNWSWRVSPYSLTRHSIPFRKGRHNIHFFNAREGYSEYYKDTFVVDFEAPLGSLGIEGGNNYVNRLDIVLRLQAKDDVSGVHSFRMREGFADWTIWEPFAELFPWTLASGVDGERIIDVQYQDKAGNLSQVYSLSVILDRVPPEVYDLKFLELLAYSTTVQIRTNKDVLIEANLYSRFGGESHKSQTKRYTTRHDIEFNGLRSNTDYELSLILKDKAGNTKTLTGYSLRTRYDSYPPQGGIKFAGGITETNQPQVDLELWATDDGGGVVYYSLSNDSYNWSSWTPLRTKRVSWRLSSGDGAKVVYVRYRDESQNISPIYSANIRLYSQPLLLTLTKSEAKANQIELSWSANREVQCEITIKGSGLNRSIKLTDWLKNNNYTFSNLKANTVYKITIEAIDKNGAKGKLGPLDITTAGGGINLAHSQRGTKASASSTHKTEANSFSPGKANDGSPQTYWQAAEPPRQGNAQWFELAFKTSEKFNSFMIYVPVLSPIGEFSLDYLATDNRWHPLASLKNNAPTSGSIKIIKGEYIAYQVTFPVVTGKAVRLIIYAGGDPLRLYLPQLLEWEVYLN